MLCIYQDFKNVQEVKLAAEDSRICMCTVTQYLMGRGDIVKETHLEVFNTKDKALLESIPQVSKII